jgi:DNA polymerase III subunit delta'
MNKVLTIPLPWQETHWQHLLHLHQVDRLPHALLFTGAAGLGKHLFATHFAKALLCKSNIGCQQCRDCLLVTANTHPDLFYVTPDKPGQGIKIAQIRSLIQLLNQTTQSAYKIFIINPAESLLASASHALLKSLEEPTPRSLFILITDKPGLLLPTIRSRCQFIRFISPPLPMGKAWIHEQISDLHRANELYYLADGAPLLAISYSKTDQLNIYHTLLISLVHILKKEVDPIKLAENYAKIDLTFTLHGLMRIVRDILKCHFLANCTHLTEKTSLHLLANLLNTPFLFSYFDKLIHLREQTTKVALNQQLLLEDLFCAWALQGEPC